MQYLPGFWCLDLLPMARHAANTCKLQIPCSCTIAAELVRWVSGVEAVIFQMHIK